MVDFGWCGIKVKEEERKTFCGTRDYLAPEMVLKKGHDEKIDIWCLGILAFELTTGRIPFSPVDVKKNNMRHHLEQLEYNILNKDPEIPEFFSESFSVFLKSLLHKDSKRRPTSM